MLCLPGYQVQRVDKKVGQGPEPIRYPSRRPRQVDDQASSPSSTNTTGKGRERRLRQPPKSNQLGQPGHLPVEDSLCCFGGDVSWAKASAARGHDQIRPRRRELKKVRNPIGLIWYDEGAVHVESQRQQSRPSRRTGQILPRSSINGIAHRDDYGGFGLD